MNTARTSSRSADGDGAVRGGVTGAGATGRAVLNAARRAARRLWWALRFARQNVRIDPSSSIGRLSVIRTCGGGSIRIGRQCEIHDYAMILTYGGDIRIGDNCSVNPFTIIYGHGGATIGDGVRIAAHCVVIPANHIPGDPTRPVHQTGVEARGIQIGDHVWIGAGARILDGVAIGSHAIVGAGSVVTRSIPELATAFGVPARVVSSGPAVNS